MRAPRTTAGMLAGVMFSLLPAGPAPTLSRASTVGVSDPALVVPQSSMARPAPGVLTSDPDFGSTIRRISAGTLRGGFGTHIYSQLQAFSSDDEYVLLIESSGYVVRRLHDLSRVRGLDTSGWLAPRWYPAEPHTIIHFDDNSNDTVRVETTNVDTLHTALIYTFLATYRTVFSNQSFDELSRDGRWMAGMLRRTDGASVIFSLDTLDGTLGAVLAVPALYSGPCSPDPTWGEVPPDWTAPDPLGRYLVVQWVRDGTTRCSGLETFDIRTGAFIGRVYDGHQHGDLGVMPDGRTEFFMTYELYDPNGQESIGIRLLPGTATASEPFYLTSEDWLGEHISCQGPYGVCVVTTGLRPGRWRALEGEIFLQYSDGSILRIAHHRSTSCGYWVQPRASMSLDGRYVIFASDWGTPSCGPGHKLGRGEAYVVDLGPQA